MTRTRATLVLASLGLSGVLGLTACGVTAARPAEGSATAGVADEASALRTVGLQTEPSPSASAAKGTHRHGGVRRYLRKNTLHGEVAAQGKDGTRTIVVQRGTVTATGSGSVTVKSADGFALTWTYGDKLRVVQDKKKVGADAVTTGVRIGVAGRRDGDATTARLIVVE
ncbi:hypothetical protein [Mangrovihabitans endophyticus]|nr:hypothetical protein [Mangrovihabitans endophyticus]